MKFCESYGYFALSQILVIYLHNEFGLSDIQAGAIYGIWGLCITFWGISLSWFNDNLGEYYFVPMINITTLSIDLGVRKSLILGFSISAVASVTLTVSSSRWTMYFVLFGLLPIGNCMGMPMLTVGIKRYTTVENR